MASPLLRRRTERPSRAWAGQHTKPRPFQFLHGPQEEDLQGSDNVSVLHFESEEKTHE